MCKNPNFKKLDLNQIALAYADARQRHLATNGYFYICRFSL